MLLIKQGRVFVNQTLPQLVRVLLLDREVGRHLDQCVEVTWVGEIVPIYHAEERQDRQKVFESH